MKKLFSFIALSGFLFLGTIVKAEDSIPSNTSGTATTTVTAKTDAQPQEKVVEATTSQVIKQKFIEGGPIWMAPVLLCLILGLAICIERIIYLNMATTNTDKLLSKIEDALKNGGVESAKEICRNTRGPVASIFYQGLDRSEEGLEMVEKSILAYGSVQTGQLEKGLSWIALFIALAPMLGFLGTVIGMIGAFDAIAIAKNISPDVVAGGIKVALLTTVAGLIVAIVLQIFYNYIVSKIDGIINEMEDSSINFMDILIKSKVVAEGSK
jgi:biopolymer transport protein ExbB